jgi:2-oxoglutarate ferredoxin oxidoreductase subunit beta
MRIEKVWAAPQVLALSPACPGCQYWTIGRIIAEVLEELDIEGKAIAVMGIGCNNANYGTTGGQLAPTTLTGQITTTTPDGRNVITEGYPVHTAELVATFTGVAYSARSAVNTSANYQRTKKCIKAAFQKQVDQIGLSFVEVLSACPPNWHLSPVESLKWIEEKMIPEFPLGEFKNVKRID